MFDALEQRLLAQHVLLAAFRSFRRTIKTFFEGGEIRKRKLGVYDVDVGEWIDSSRHVDDICAVKGTHDVCDRIHFADVRKELISKAFALRCAGDEPGNINKLDGRRQDLFGLRNCRKLSQ